MEILFSETLVPSKPQTVAFSKTPVSVQLPWDICPAETPISPPSWGHIFGRGLRSSHWSYTERTVSFLSVIWRMKVNEEFLVDVISSSDALLGSIVSRCTCPSGRRRKWVIVWNMFDWESFRLLYLMRGSPAGHGISKKEDYSFSKKTPPSESPSSWIHPGLRWVTRATKEMTCL